jgi:protein ImuB
MAALPDPSSPVLLPPRARHKARYRQPSELWMAVLVLGSPPVADLESLAAWAYRLTSRVVLQPPAEVLLEVRGSLKLFTGLDAIKQRLAEELDRRQWRYRLTTAPTLLAASWLVRYESVDVLETGVLAGVVGRLPLAATAWPQRTQVLLRQMGLRTIADCLRLPRAGFTRRIGKRYLDDLDRALGRMPDIRTGYHAPTRLHELAELENETIDRTWLGNVLSSLVAKVAAELRRRQAQVREVVLGCDHLHSAATLTRVRFVDPVHEQERILAPLLARLERLELAEPVVALSLETADLLPLAAAMPGLPNLFSRADRAIGQGRAVPEFALLECLRGRFGEQCVHGIGLVAEHRPERAWCRWIDQPSAPPAEGAVPQAERPLWLLPEPRRKRPHGSVALPAPERIESGWWDGQDVRRDYHVVTGPAGERLWVYWDAVAREWYLHGLFG